MYVIELCHMTVMQILYVEQCDFIFAEYGQV